MIPSSVCPDEPFLPHIQPGLVHFEAFTEFIYKKSVHFDNLIGQHVHRQDR